MPKDVDEMFLLPNIIWILFLNIRWLQAGENVEVEDSVERAGTTYM